MNQRFIISSTLVSLMTLLFLYSCGPMSNISGRVEDDIYYVPGKKALKEKEVESRGGTDISDNQSTNDYKDSRPVINSNGTVENLSAQALVAEAQDRLNSSNEINEIIYENTGYWIGGFKGSVQDLKEAARIIRQYPEGFGFASNGTDIAMNLAFDPDWNVYVDNNRFWWFPSPSNIDLYSTFVFGTYPNYIWTVAWNSPSYNSWAVHPYFDWGFSFSWGRPGWNIGLGWHANSWYYDPWYYSPYSSRWSYGWHNPPYWYSGHHHYTPGYNPPTHTENRPIRPGSSVTPSVRPGTSVRPGATTRPSTSVRPGTATRPTAVLRPGTSSRPATTTRPSATTRPEATTRPATTTRPAATRPSTTTRPNAVTRPGGTSGSNYTRPSSNNIKNYSQPPVNNQRPTYNSRSSSTRSTYQSPGSSRPSSGASRPSSRPSTSRPTRR